MVRWEGFGVCWIFSFCFFPLPLLFLLLPSKIYFIHLQWHQPWDRENGLKPLCPQGECSAHKCIYSLGCSSIFWSPSSSCRSGRLGGVAPSVSEHSPSLQPGEGHPASVNAYMEMQLKHLFSSPFFPSSPLPPPCYALFLFHFFLLHLPLPPE